MTKSEIVEVFNECKEMTVEHASILQDVECRFDRLLCKGGGIHGEDLYELQTMEMLEKLAKESEAKITEKLCIVERALAEGD